MTINNATLGVSIAAILVTVGVTVWWQRRRIRMPNKWREVGKISELVLYPLKSGQGIEVDEAECTKVGLKYGNLRDRFFLVYDERKHNFVSARKFSDMVLITTESRSKDVFIFNAPEMPPITVNLKELGEKVTCTVWGNSVEAFDCGDPVAVWLSRFIYHSNSGVRLGYSRRETAQRDMKQYAKAHPKFSRNDVGIYSDASSFLLICESSVNDLNERLENKVVPRNFRPNILVQGTVPYEEDNWDWIKIGNVIFRNVKPCTRCVLTTVDPESGHMDPNREPLETLKTYRQLTDPEARKLDGSAPVMGINMGVYSRGSIKVGDQVFVSEE